MSGFDYFAKPYTVRQAALWGRYNVVFEDSNIIISGGLQQAKRIADALNGAYNLGRMYEIQKAGDNQ